MTIKEFLRRYTLHDSLIDGITYDPKKKTLTLRVDFCYWMQDGYVEGQPEPELAVTFHGVDRYDGVQGELPQDICLGCSVDGDRVSIVLEGEACYVLSFDAAGVTMTPLEAGD